VYPHCNSPIDSIYCRRNNSRRNTNPYKSSQWKRTGRTRGGADFISTLTLTSKKMGWVVNATPSPLYLRERTGTNCMGGCVGPRAGLDRCGKSRHNWDSTLRTVQPRSESPNRLSYKSVRIVYCIKRSIPVAVLPLGRKYIHVLIHEEIYLLLTNHRMAGHGAKVQLYFFLLWNWI